MNSVCRISTFLVCDVHCLFPHKITPVRFPGGDNKHEYPARIVPETTVSLNATDFGPYHTAQPSHCLFVFRQMEIVRLAHDHVIHLAVQQPVTGIMESVFQIELISAKTLPVVLCREVK